MLLLDRTTSRFSPVSRSILSILSVRASHQYSFPSCGDERTSQLVWGQHYHPSAPLAGCAGVQATLDNPPETLEAQGGQPCPHQQDTATGDPLGLV